MYCQVRAVLQGNQTMPGVLVGQVSMWAVFLAVLELTLLTAFTVKLPDIKKNVECSKLPSMQSSTPYKTLIQRVFTSSKLPQFTNMGHFKIYNSLMGSQFVLVLGSIFCPCPVYCCLPMTVHESAIRFIYVL